MLGITLQENRFALITIDGDAIDEIMSAHFDIMGDEVSLVVPPPDLARGFPSFMLGPSVNNAYWQKKIEFMQKLHELYFSGDYDIKLYENRSTKQTL